jgi:hypothetical protein
MGERKYTGSGQEWTGNNDGFKDGTRTIWNKNLTKYNDDRIKKMSETMPDRSKPDWVVSSAFRSQS